MAVGLSSGIANEILDALCRNNAWTFPTAVYIQLHTADPGSAGTTAIATNSTRVQATFGNAASGGAISNSASIDWTNVPAAEDYAFYSAWSASTSGTFLWSDDLAANAVAIGDNFSIPIGELDVTLVPVAA